MQEFFGNKIIPTLREYSKIIQKGMLLWKQWFEALMRFPNGKAFDNDGLTPLFYTCNFTLNLYARSKTLYQLPSSLILLYVTGVKFVKLYFMWNKVLLVKVRICKTKTKIKQAWLYR